MKKLSIITICLNEPDLEKTCESIVCQTWQDFEWIVLDGGSNAQTLAIFEKYKGRIDKFISGKDGGIYDAYNKGVALASGKFLNFMNAGDSFYHKNVLKFFDISAQDDDADVYYGQTNFFYQDKLKRVELSHHPKNVSRNYFILEVPNTQAMFIKKELFDKYGLFDRRYKIAADYDRWLCFFTNKAVFKSIPVVVAIYNMYGISTSKSTAIEIRNIKHNYFTQEEIERGENALPMKYKWLELLFSIKNTPLITYKIITILGFRIKIRVKSKTCGRIGSRGGKNKLYCIFG